jgi:hypothetical protein
LALTTKREGVLRKYIKDARAKGFSSEKIRSHLVKQGIVASDVAHLFKEDVVSPRVEKYIKDARAKGFSDVQIKARLVESGINPAMVAKAMVVKVVKDTLFRLGVMAGITFLLGMALLVVVGVNSVFDEPAEIVDVPVDVQEFLPICQEDIDCDAGFYCYNGDCFVKDSGENLIFEDDTSAGTTSLVPSVDDVVLDAPEQEIEDIVEDVVSSEPLLPLENLNIIDFLLRADTEEDDTEEEIINVIENSFDPVASLDTIKFIVDESDDGDEEKYNIVDLLLDGDLTPENKLDIVEFALDTQDEDDGFEADVRDVIEDPVLEIDEKLELIVTLVDSNDDSLVTFTPKQSEDLITIVIQEEEEEPFVEIDGIITSDGFDPTTKLSLIAEVVETDDSDDALVKVVKDLSVDLSLNNFQADLVLDKAEEDGRFGFVAVERSEVSYDSKSILVKVVDILEVDGEESLVRFTPEQSEDLITIVIQEEEEEPFVEIGGIVTSDGFDAITKLSLIAEVVESDDSDDALVKVVRDLSVDLSLNNFQSDLVLDKAEEDDRFSFVAVERSEVDYDSKSILVKVVDTLEEGDGPVVSKAQEAKEARIIFLQEKKKEKESEERAEVVVSIKDLSLGLDLNSKQRVIFIEKVVEDDDDIIYKEVSEIVSSSMNYGNKLKAIAAQLDSGSSDDSVLQQEIAVLETHSSLPALLALDVINEIVGYENDRGDLDEHEKDIVKVVRDSAKSPVERLIQIQALVESIDEEPLELLPSESADAIDTPELVDLDAPVEGEEPEPLELLPSESADAIDTPELVDLDAPVEDEEPEPLELLPSESADAIDTPEFVDLDESEDSVLDIIGKLSKGVALEGELREEVIMILLERSGVDEDEIEHIEPIEDSGLDVISALAGAGKLTPEQSLDVIIFVAETYEEDDGFFDRVSVVAQSGRDGPIETMHEVAGLAEEEEGFGAIMLGAPEASGNVWLDIWYWLLGY